MKTSAGMICWIGFRWDIQRINNQRNFKLIEIRSASTTFTSDSDTIETQVSELIEELNNMKSLQTKGGAHKRQQRDQEQYEAQEALSEGKP